MGKYQEPLVFLVGAGPGHPELVTVRAVNCLAQADLVLYDRLVSARILDYAPIHAERVCVTQLGEHHRDRGSKVQDIMLGAARQGKRLVRLKGGDPFVFGRGGEEAEFLRQAGIPFEIVPGITAGIAAGIFTGIPLTHRFSSSAVALVTGHELSEKDESALDWANLSRFSGTLVFYMGFARLPIIVDSLIQHGKDPATPAALVRLASTAEQQTVEASLQELPAKVDAAGLTSPAILLVGPVVALRSQLAWFEKRPLFGKRVLVTRPRHQALDLVRRLEGLGANPVVLPVVDVGPPKDWGPVDLAIAGLADYQWLVFTSTNGVQAFFQRLRKTGHDLRSLGNIRLAVIGPGTANALRQYHLEPDLVPPQYRSESLALALSEKARGQRILLARADRGRDLLRTQLSRVATVDPIVVYSQGIVLDPKSEVFNYLRHGEMDFVTLTSSNIAKAFLENLDRECRAQILTGKAKLVSISPVTSAEIKKSGFPVAAEATEYTMAGVVEALLNAASSATVNPAGHSIPNKPIDPRL
jgi:uroporphyrinogen III methyltransferase / synthase